MCAPGPAAPARRCWCAAQRRRRHPAAGRPASAPPPPGRRAAAVPPRSRPLRRGPSPFSLSQPLQVIRILVAPSTPHAPQLVAPHTLQLAAPHALQLAAPRAPELGARRAPQLCSRGGSQHAPCVLPEGDGAHRETGTPCFRAALVRARIRRQVLGGEQGLTEAPAARSGCGQRTGGEDGHHRRPPLIGRRGLHECSQGGGRCVRQGGGRPERQRRPLPGGGLGAGPLQRPQQHGRHPARSALHLGTAEAGVHTTRGPAAGGRCKAAGALPGSALSAYVPVLASGCHLCVLRSNELGRWKEGGSRWQDWVCSEQTAQLRARCHVAVCVAAGTACAAAGTGLQHVAVCLRGGLCLGGGPHEQASGAGGGSRGGAAGAPRGGLEGTPSGSSSSRREREPPMLGRGSGAASCVLCCAPSIAPAVPPAQGPHRADWIMGSIQAITAWGRAKASCCRWLLPQTGTSTLLATTGSCSIAGTMYPCKQPTLAVTKQSGVTQLADQNGQRVARVEPHTLCALQHHEPAEL